MGEHKAQKMRGGKVRTADEYKASGEAKRTRATKAETEKRMRDRIEECVLGVKQQ